MIEHSCRDSDGPAAKAHVAPDLARLNEAEREALRLLAEGHTAKSIAGLTGRSVAAVNERLREARRKTGIGSSREHLPLAPVQFQSFRLALKPHRRLKAQKGVNVIVYPLVAGKELSVRDAKHSPRFKAKQRATLNAVASLDRLRGYYLSRTPCGSEHN
ncbi:MAG TPA: sigma factor-like helix-turn-helix DNA-binding protein [Chthoniobacteraceae bacterium]|nr:sigma factor-like helix-turn-helix DNA-binding protein [Chthoniobacteraceae bacterium]